LVKLLVKEVYILYYSVMRTKVSKRGQISVPSKIRKQLHIGPDTTLEWVVEGATARVIPVPADPVRAFRGSGKNGLVKQLLKERRRDRQREDASQK
jgi:AbrB family looped-hinge helix DNA binding protein